MFHEGRKLLQHPKQVVEIVVFAGELLKVEWLRVDGPRDSGDKADIDAEIEQLLHGRLQALLKCDFCGEKTIRRLSDHPYCWVVDRNDVTSDFLRGTKGSAISGGVLHDRVPVLGVVYAPVTETLGSDCIAWAEGCPSLLRNGQPVVSGHSRECLVAGANLLVSYAAVNKPKLNSELCDPANFFPNPGITYRLARVVAGDGVCAVSLHPVSAHYVVAGGALIRGADRHLIDERGDVITYEKLADFGAVSQFCFGARHMRATRFFSVTGTRFWLQLTRTERAFDARFTRY